MPSRAFAPIAVLLAAGCFASAVSTRAIADTTPASEWVGVTPARLPAAPIGYRFAAPPVVPPGWAPGARHTLADVREALAAGDVPRALGLAREVATGRHSRDRAAAWGVIGTLHEEAGHANQASEAFTKVRASGGPLAAWGAWHEAEQDLRRGRPTVAARECAAYRTRWPEGDNADDCLRLIASAHASLGRHGPAMEAATAYDADHADGPIREQTRLKVALVWAQDDPERAVPLLHQLLASHRAPLTGRSAEQTLARLERAGVPGAALPTDLAFAKGRAVSLREVRRHTEAWQAFRSLADQADDDPALQAWVDQEATTFGWRTHRWDFLADVYGARYADKPDPNTAWSAWKVLARGGRHAESVGWIKAGLDDHGDEGQWRRNVEHTARELLLGRDYPRARSVFDGLAEKGGITGRRAAFFAGFASWMNGDAADAVRRFSAIIDEGKGHLTEARYWRARALERTEPARAAADRAWIRGRDPNGWYALLLDQSATRGPAMLPSARNGGWPVLPPATASAATASLTGPIPVGAPTPPELRRAPEALAQLTWPLRAEAPRTESPPDVWSALDAAVPPHPAVPAALYDPAAAEKLLEGVVATYGDRWPALATTYDFARAGLYDLSGPQMSRMFEDWRLAHRKRDPVARKLGKELQQSEWRAIFQLTQDHHHAARFSYGLARHLDDADLQRAARRLALPIAHGRRVWEASAQHGLDPYLVTALMRVESVFDANARSRVGARGAMQIMPRTGHLLADLARDTAFTAGDLTDPLLSVSYGITYLGLLMERFDDVFPLAVASYNGGPHNVSAWLQGTGTDMPMDAWVEHIPYQETRRYVKRVSGYYGEYVDLYAHGGTHVVMPAHPLGDHPEIVDF